MTCVSCHGAKLLQLLHKTFLPFALLMGIGLYIPMNEVSRRKVTCKDGPRGTSGMPSPADDLSK